MYSVKNCVKLSETLQKDKSISIQVHYHSNFVAKMKLKKLLEFTKFPQNYVHVGLHLNLIAYDANIFKLKKI